MRRADGIAEVLDVKSGMLMETDFVPMGKGEKKMPKIINAETLKRFMRLNPEEWHTPDERWLPESDIAHAIDICPEADAVEVVRCRDCKYGKIVEGVLVKCSFGHYYPIDYFCADGERRESK